MPALMMEATMGRIFDGHAYCFPSLRGPAGFSDPALFGRHLQHAIATHFQPLWRMGDRAPADSRLLVDPAIWPRLDAVRAARETRFRAADNGRFEWTLDGEEYVKQYLPPSIADMQYPPDRLVAEMDYAGVDRALLHRTPYLGVGNEFVADCVRLFPDRLLGLAHVEEWLVQEDPAGAFGKLERAVRQQGLSGLQFLPPQLDLYGQDGPWDGAGFRPFWDGVAGLKIPVFFSLKERADPRRESYLNELRTLLRWMQRYPDVTVVLTHGLNWRLFVDGDRIQLPEEVWAPFANPRAYLQLLFPITLGGLWDYPLSQVRPVVEACVRRVGAHRLMWGTDMPIVLRFWTYRQNVDFIRRYCDFLSPAEIDAVMGDTAAALLGA
ncbi:MAG TPA: amidohydrolase family protein [Chloroflexota bacterium]|jgi:predicted TIM-barrel fold metal-dependent hydrolase